MKTANCPFSEKEIDSYMQTAFDYVKNNHPDVKGLQWDEKIKESLRIQYAKGSEESARKNWEDVTDTHDAHLFADLVFDGYYEML
jgi:hypothetical protein